MIEPKEKGLSREANAAARNPDYGYPLLRDKMKHATRHEMKELRSLGNCKKAVVVIR